MRFVTKYKSLMRCICLQEDSEFGSTKHSRLSRVDRVRLHNSQINHIVKLKTSSIPLITTRLHAIKPSKSLYQGYSLGLHVYNKLDINNVNKADIQETTVHPCSSHAKSSTLYTQNYSTNILPENKFSSVSSNLRLLT